MVAKVTHAHLLCMYTSEKNDAMLSFFLHYIRKRKRCICYWDFISDTCGWEVKLMLFNAMVTKVLLSGVEVWGRTISLNAWNEIEKIQKMFSRRQLGVKCTTSYQVVLLETGVQPIEQLALQSGDRPAKELKEVKTRMWKGDYIRESTNIK